MLRGGDAGAVREMNRGDDSAWMLGFRGRGGGRDGGGGRCGGGRVVWSWWRWG